MTLLTATLSDLDRLENFLNQLGTIGLTVSEIEVASDLVDRVKRYLSGSTGPDYKFTNEERLVHLLEVKKNLEKAREIPFFSSNDFQLFQVLLTSALTHLLDIDPEETVYIQCQSCHRKIKVSRMQTYEEMTGHWEFGDPPYHQDKEGVDCLEGITMTADPAWSLEKQADFHDAEIKKLSQKLILLTS